MALQEGTTDSSGTSLEAAPNLGLSGYARFVAQYSGFSRQLFVNSNSGDDANLCNHTQPCRSIGRAAALANAGTVVWVEDGIYNESVSTFRSGTVSNPIAYVSVNKWGAKIVASGVDSILSNSGNYVDIIGFDVSGSNSRLAIITGGSFTRIAWNHVHDMGQNAGNNGSAAILDGGAWTLNGVEIFNNSIHDIAPYPAKSSTSGHAIYPQNNGTKIYNNLIYRATNGIAGDHAATNLVVTNNTISQIANVAIAIWGGSSPGIPIKSCLVANNIITDSLYGMVQGGTADSTNVYTHNLLFSVGTAIYGTILNSQVSSTINANPLFTNPSAFDFHILSGSPAVNKGLNSGAPIFDFDFLERRVDGDVDIGAFERH